MASPRPVPKRLGTRRGQRLKPELLQASYSADILRIGLDEATLLVQSAKGSAFGSKIIRHIFPLRIENQIL